MINLPSSRSGDRQLTFIFYSVLGNHSTAETLQKNEMTGNKLLKTLMTRFQQLVDTS